MVSGGFPERPEPPEQLPVTLAPARAPADGVAVPPDDADPTCRDGVRLEMGPGDAAAGLRILAIEMVNCGRGEYRVKGYPVVRPLDEHRAAVDVQVLDGIGKVTHADPPLEGPPAPVVLAPGQRAEAVIVWRNTYTDISHPPVTVPLLDVAPVAGAATQLLAPEGALDLGSTGRFGVSPWRKSAAPPASVPPAPVLGGLENVFLTPSG